MAGKIREFFGYDVDDHSARSMQARENQQCPVLNRKCVKTLSDGTLSGVCTLETGQAGKVVCCPIRLYADNYKEIKPIANVAFGTSCVLVRSDKVHESDANDNRVLVFGRNWGGELSVPSGKGRYSVDWVLAQINRENDLIKFLAVEVQTIDTTGNYRAARKSLLDGEAKQAKCEAGLNWENVNKRIIPQLIYKANILSRESKCSDGLFFVCPAPVYRRILDRLALGLSEFPSRDRSSITFCPYTLSEDRHDGHLTALSPDKMYTTSVSQVATAFSVMRNLPEPNVYESAIRRVL